MSLKRKLFPKRERFTVLAFGEGGTEEAVLRHIKSSYPITQIRIRVDNGGGGSPDSIVRKAVNYVGEFQRRFILLDTDKQWMKEVEDKATKKGIVMLGSSCCIEGFLLILLEPKFKSKHREGIKGDCESIFHKKYLSRTEKLNYRNYEKYFPKKKLEQLRKKNAVLDQLIHFMTEIPKEFYTQS